MHNKKQKVKAVNNKKFMAILLLLVPTPTIATDMDVQYQMLDLQIEKLTAERNSKKELLHECEKATRKFKIAGTATLTATGIGAIVNDNLKKKIENMSANNSGNHNSIANPASMPNAIETNCKQVCDGDQSCIKECIEFYQKNN